MGIQPPSVWKNLHVWHGDDCVGSGCESQGQGILECCCAAVSRCILAQDSYAEKDRQQHPANWQEFYAGDWQCCWWCWCTEQTPECQSLQGSQSYHGDAGQVRRCLDQAWYDSAACEILCRQLPWKAQRIECLHASVRLLQECCNSGGCLLQLEVQAGSVCHFIWQACPQSRITGDDVPRRLDNLNQGRETLHLSNWENVHPVLGHLIPEGCCEDICNGLCDRWKARIQR